MDRELRKIFTVTKKENIVDVIIPKKKTDKAKVLVKISNDFSISGTADSIICELEEYRRNYTDVYIEDGTESDYYSDDYTVHRIYGYREETDEEYLKRQEYHKKQNEKKKIARDKKKEEKKLNLQKKEAEERKEYQRLKEKYGD